jgi:hypothetical protein
LIYICEFELLAPDRLPTTLRVERVFASDNDYSSLPIAGVDGVARRLAPPINLM